MINNNSVSEKVSGYSNCEHGEKHLSANNGDIILNANSSRAYAAFINNSSVDITLVLADKSRAALNRGIILKPRGGSYEVNKNNLYLGAISAIAASSCTLSYVECD